MSRPPDLTAKDKILIHLYLEKEPGWAMEYPESHTQEGMAETVGVSRAYISQCLSSLEEDDMVECKKARVSGHKRKKKTYRLKEAARKKAGGLYEKLLESEIRTDEGVDSSFEALTEEEDLDFLEAYNQWEDKGYVKVSKGEEQDSEEEKEKAQNPHEVKREIEISTPIVRQTHSDIEQVQRETKTLENEKIEKRRKLPYAGLILLLVPSIMIFNLYFSTVSTIESFFCFLFPISLILGMAMMGSYFSNIEGRDKVIEQLFSADVFLILFSFLFLLSLMDFYKVRFPADIYAFTSVFFSLLVVLFLPFPSVKKYRSRLAFGASSVLVSYGLFSFVIPDTLLSTTMPLYWVLGGIFIFDSGFRWFKEEGWMCDVIRGVNIFVIFSVVFFLSFLPLVWHKILTGVLWLFLCGYMILGPLVTQTSVSELFLNLWNGVPVILALVFGLIGLLLLMGERYLEGSIEIILSTVFIIGLIKEGKDIHRSLMWGLPTGLAIAFTLVSLAIL